MELFKTTYLLVFSLFFPLSINPSNHYVDKNTSGANDGTSWDNAWQSFSAINWSKISPGDIIYISGGRDSTVYYENLFIGDVQGTAANPITIKNSYDAEHNGRVIIDGEHKTRRECIHIGEGGSNYSTDYITISGLELRGAYIGIWIHQQASSLVFDSLTITDWEFAGIFTQGLTNQHESIDGVIIQNSSLIGELLSGADCLQFNSSSNHIIRNNFIHQRNTSTVNNHVDGMLGMWCAGFRVYNNVVIVDSNAQGHPYILRARADASDEDSVIVYNNFFYQGGIWHSEGTGAYNWSTAFLLRYNEEGYERPPTFVAHNTIVTYGPTVQGVHYETGAMLVNNIIAMFGNGMQSSRPGGGTYQWLNAIRGFGTSPGINVNRLKSCLIWREWGEGYSPRVMIDGYWTGNEQTINKPTWAEWKGTLGGKGINADPLFVVDIDKVHGSAQALVNGELKPNSPAINAGEDIQAIIERMGLPWTDINGNPRPDSPTLPDIGAYQYVP